MTDSVPLTLEVPFRFDQPLDMDDARKAAKSVAEARRQAREWFQRATLDAAAKERDYRKLRAEKWIRVEGTAEEKKDQVNAETADARFARDVALGVVKASQERLEEVDAERASLHRLLDWSMKIAPLQAPEPERYPPAIGAMRH